MRTQYLCFADFFLLKAIKHLGVGFILIIVATSVGASNLFLYCYFGQSSNGQYLSISDSYYNSNWPKLPSEQQKFFIIMIANAQRPLRYHGFGLAFLDLNTFLKVSF